MKSTYNVRFERLAEEFAPSTPKPEPVKSGRQRYVSQPSDIPRAQGIVRKSYPLIQVGVTVRMPSEISNNLSKEQTNNLVRRDLAQRLAESLISQMTIESDYDIEQMVTRYFTRLIIADPKRVGASVEEYATAKGL